MSRPRWRVRFARWLLSTAARLAWMIGGKAAYGRAVMAPRAYCGWVVAGLWGPE
jgi:hypothetical protein